MSGTPPRKQKKFFGNEEKKLNDSPKLLERYRHSEGVPKSWQQRNKSSDDGRSSPKSMQSQPVFGADVALSNFRARKKTIAEFLQPLTGLFTKGRLSAFERVSNRGPKMDAIRRSEETRRVRGRFYLVFICSAFN